jgi:hypothetical protein
MFFNFKIGHQWVSIPKPFELSLVGAGVDRIMSKMFGNKDAFKGYGGSVAKGVLPVDQANLVPVAPSLVENMMNYDLFRDQSIVPPSENALDLSLRNTDRASRIGQFIQDKTGMADARKIDHFIKGQFSYFGGAALKLSNIGKKEGEKFGIKDLGFFKDSPVYNSPQVQDLMEYSDKWGLNQSRTMKEMYRMLSDYNSEKDADRKEDIGKSIRQFAKISLERLESSNIEEQKQERAEIKRERRRAKAD